MKRCVELQPREMNFARITSSREVLWLPHGCSARKLSAPHAMPGWNTPRGYIRCAISGRAARSPRDRLSTVFEETGGAKLAESATPLSFDIYREGHSCALAFIPPIIRIQRFGAWSRVCSRGRLD